MQFYYLPFQMPYGLNALRGMTDLLAGLTLKPQSAKQMEQGTGDEDLFKQFVPRVSLQQFPSRHRLDNFLSERHALAAISRLRRVLCNISGAQMDAIDREIFITQDYLEMIGTVIADTILQTPEDLCPNMDCMWQDRRYIRPRKKSNTPNDNWDINLASKKDLLQPKAPDSEIAFAQYYSFLPDTKVEPIDSLPKTESTRTPLNSVHNLCPCGGKVIVWCFQGAVCRRHNFTIHIITPNVFFYRNFDPRFSTVHGTRPNENVTKNQWGMMTCYTHWLYSYFLA